MQTQEIGQYVIKSLANASTIQEKITGDKQDDDQDNANYERMEQFKEFEFDAEKHPTLQNIYTIGYTRNGDNTFNQQGLLQK